MPKKLLLLLLFLLGQSYVYGQLELIKRDSQRINDFSLLHQDIQNYQVSEEIVLFKNIIDSLALEIQRTDQKGIKAEKKTLKTFFEEFHGNLVKLKETQITNDSLFEALRTTQHTLFEAYKTETDQKGKKYRKDRKTLRLRNLYRSYQKNIFKLEKQHRLILLNTNTFDDFFRRKGWNESPVSQLIAYINQSLLDLQKNRIDAVKKDVASIITQLENQIDSLNQTATAKEVAIEQRNEKIKEQRLEIDSISNIVFDKNENSQQLKFAIDFQENNLAVLQRNFDLKVIEFNEAQDKLQDLRLTAEKRIKQNEVLTTATKSLNFTIDSLEEKGAYVTLQNENLINQQQQLRQEKIQTESWLKILTTISILGIILLALATNRMNKEKQKVSKAYTELEKTKDLLQLRTKQLNLSHRELNHRIKNNLQQISSLIFLQEDEIEDKKAKASFNALQGRIDTIKIVHQKLYAKKQQQLTMVNIAEYVSDLVQYIVGEDAKVTLDIQKLDIEMDHATDIGLIINELVTNSTKYAFTRRNTNPKLSVHIKAKEEQLFLEVKDNGPGFPLDFSLEEIDSFGLKSIVEMFVYKSGKGVLKTFNEEGAVVQILLPFDIPQGKLVA